MGTAAEDFYLSVQFNHENQKICPTLWRCVVSPRLNCAICCWRHTVSGVCQENRTKTQARLVSGLRCLCIAVIGRAGRKIRDIFECLKTREETAK